MKTLYIHVGIGKTGTTSIQHALAQGSHSGEYLYPITGRIDVDHRDLSPLHFDAINPELQQLYASLKRELSSYHGDKAILSSEFLFFAKPFQWSYIHAASVDYQVKIVVYLRAQATMIESAYLQWIRAFSEPIYPRVEDFYRDHWGSFDYLERLKLFSEYFGAENVIARHYHKDIDSVADFASVCNIDLAGSYGVLKNPSLNPAALALALKIRNLDISLAVKMELMQDLVSIEQSQAILIDDQLQSKIIADYKSSNNKICDMFGIDDLSAC